MKHSSFILSVIISIAPVIFIHSADQHAIPFEYGHSHAIGSQKKVIEDRHAIHSFTKDTIQHTVFTICDGHKGDTVARVLTGQDETYKHIKPLHQRIEEASSFTQESYESLFEAMQKDIESLKGNASGSTVVLAHLFANNLHILWTGDSRAFVADNSSNIIFSTTDHKPNDPEEKDFIEQHGGSVQKDAHGIYRVNGRINISRSFEAEGFSGRYKGLTQKPNFHDIKITPSLKALVLASDGAFDVKGDRLRSWNFINAALKEKAPKQKNAQNIISSGNNERAQQATRYLCNVMQNIIYKKPDDISTFVILLNSYFQQEK